jgi:hypothetical protein
MCGRKRQPGGSSISKCLGGAPGLHHPQEEPMQRNGTPVAQNASAVLVRTPPKQASRSTPERPTSIPSPSTSIILAHAAHGPQPPAAVARRLRYRLSQLAHGDVASAPAGHDTTHYPLQLQTRPVSARRRAETPRPNHSSALPRPLRVAAPMRVPLPLALALSNTLEPRGLGVGRKSQHMMPSAPGLAVLAFQNPRPRG